MPIPYTFFCAPIPLVKLLKNDFLKIVMKIQKVLLRHTLKNKTENTVLHSLKDDENTDKSNMIWLSTLNGNFDNP